MSLWRLPPIVIIQLKRFQFTQHMRRKLRDLVVFPVEGLDLSRIVASDSAPIGQDADEDGKRRNDVKETGLNGKSHHESAFLDDENTKSDSCSVSQLSAADNNGRSMMLYDLYGVIHHQGALSGGHYVASLKSDVDGQWRLFNDAQIYEIHSRDVVDSSAYILFYMRRDVHEKRLSDFWDVRLREGEGLTEDEMNKLMKGRTDRCTIS